MHVLMIILSYIIYHISLATTVQEFIFLFLKIFIHKRNDKKFSKDYKRSGLQTQGLIRHPLAECPKIQAGMAHRGKGNEKIKWKKR